MLSFIVKYYVQNIQEVKKRPSKYKSHCNRMCVVSNFVERKICIVHDFVQDSKVALSTTSQQSYTAHSPVLLKVIQNLT